MVAKDEKPGLFEEIVADNRRRILAIARSFAPPNDREDLCQEILLQMWRGLDRFEGRSAVSTWVYRVALNTAITFRRKNGRRIGPRCEALESLGWELPAPAAVDSTSQIQILEGFLFSLGKIDRAVFLLYLEGLSYREIGEVTGLTNSHVGVRINRLKTAFRDRCCGGVSWNSKAASQSG